MALADPICLSRFYHAYVIVTLAAAADGTTQTRLVCTSCGDIQPIT